MGQFTHFTIYADNRIKVVHVDALRKRFRKGGRIPKKYLQHFKSDLKRNIQIIRLILFGYVYQDITVSISNQLYYLIDYQFALFWCLLGYMAGYLY